MTGVDTNNNHHQQVHLDFSPHQVLQLIHVMQERRLLRTALHDDDDNHNEFDDDDDGVSMCSSVVSSLSTGGISQLVCAIVNHNTNNNNNNNNHNNNTPGNSTIESSSDHIIPGQKNPGGILPPACTTNTTMSSQYGKHPKLKVTKLHKHPIVTAALPTTPTRNNKKATVRTSNHNNNGSSSLPTLPPTMVAISPDLAKLDDSLNAILRDASQKHVQPKQSPRHYDGNQRRRHNSKTPSVAPPEQPPANEEALMPLEASGPTTVVEEFQTVIRRAQQTQQQQQRKQPSTAAPTSSSSADLTHTIDTLVQSEGFQLLAAQLGLPNTTHQVLQLLQPSQPQPPSASTSPQDQETNDHQVVDPDSSSEENEEGWEDEERTTETEEHQDDDDDDEPNTTTTAKSLDMEWTRAESKHVERDNNNDLEEGMQPPVVLDDDPQQQHREEEDDDDDIQLEIGSGMNAQELALVYNTCLALSQSQQPPQPSFSSTPPPAKKNGGDHNWGCSAAEDPEDNFEASSVSSSVLGDFSEDDEPEDMGTDHQQLAATAKIDAPPVRPDEGNANTVVERPKQQRMSLLDAAPVMSMSFKSFEPDFFDDDDDESCSVASPSTPPKTRKTTVSRPVTTGRVAKMSVMDFLQSMPDLDTLQAWMEETVSEQIADQEKQTKDNEVVPKPSPSKRVSGKQRSSQSKKKKRHSSKDRKKRSSSLGHRTTLSRRHHADDGPPRSSHRSKGSRLRNQSSKTLLSKGSSGTLNSNPSTSSRGMSWHSSISNVAEPLFEPFPKDAPATKEKTTTRSVGSRESLFSTISSGALTSATETHFDPFSEDAEIHESAGPRSRTASDENSVDPFPKDCLANLTTTSAARSSKKERHLKGDQRLESSMSVLEVGDLSKNDRVSSKSRRRRNSATIALSSRSEHLDATRRRRSAKASSGSRKNSRGTSLTRILTRDAASVAGDDKTISSRASRRSHSTGPAQRGLRRGGNSSLRDLLKKAGSKIGGAATTIRSGKNSSSDASARSRSKTSAGALRKRSFSQGPHPSRPRSSSNKGRTSFIGKDQGASNRSGRSPMPPQRSKESGASTHMRSSAGKSTRAHRTVESGVETSSKDRAQQRRRRTDKEVSSDRRVRRASTTDKREKREAKQQQHRPMDDSMRRPSLPNVMETNVEPHGKLAPRQGDMGLMAW